MSKHKQTATKTQNRSENVYVHISSLYIIQWKYIYFIYINENFYKKDYKLSVTLNVLTFWKTFDNITFYVFIIHNSACYIFSPNISSEFIKKVQLFRFTKAFVHGNLQGSKRILL